MKNNNEEKKKELYIPQEKWKRIERVRERESVCEMKKECMNMQRKVLGKE